MKVKITIATGAEFEISNKTFEDLLHEINLIKNSKSENYYLHKSTEPRIAIDVNSITLIEEIPEPNFRWVNTNEE